MVISSPTYPPTLLPEFRIPPRPRKSTHNLWSTFISSAYGAEPLRTETLDIYLFGPIPICSFYTECSDKIGPDPSIFAHTGPKEKRLN